LAKSARNIPAAYLAFDLELAASAAATNLGCATAHLTPISGAKHRKVTTTLAEFSPLKPKPWKTEEGATAVIVAGQRFTSYSLVFEQS
jgi:hypothetical protein